MLLALCGVVAACQDDCTLVGCTSGFVVRVEGDPTLVPANYQVTLTYDGASVACDLVWEDEFGTCTQSNGSLPSVRVTLVLLEPAYIEVSGSDIPDDLVLTVAREGTVVAAFEGALHYEDVYLNGRDCGVSCRTAEIVVSVPES